jgi:hypothetical protein
MLKRNLIMSDSELNIVTWNVRGISSRSCRKIKRGWLRSNLRTLTPKPGIVMLQEHKIPEADCTNLGTMGLRRGQGLWNGSIFNAIKNRWDEAIVRAWSGERGAGILRAWSRNYCPSLINIKIPLEIEI